MYPQYMLRDAGDHIEISPPLIYTEEGMMQTQHELDRGNDFHPFAPALAFLEWLRIPRSRITVVNPEAAHAQS